MSQKSEVRSQKPEARSQKPEQRKRRPPMKSNPCRSFEDLIVWQKAHKFVLSVYLFTRTFLKEEMYALTSQFRRAAVSIAANIAEGFKKRGKSDKARFYNISQGSIEECR